MIKNLTDPVKALDAKYRSIKLSNAKFQQNVLPISSAMAYLTAIAFQRQHKHQTQSQSKY